MLLRRCFGMRQQAVRFFRRDTCLSEMRSTRGSQFARRLFVSSGKPELMKAKASFPVCPVCVSAQAGVSGTGRRTPKTEFRNRL